MKSTRSAEPYTLLIMGVSGCGKTSFGKALATHLGLQFFDGDDFHPASNVEKMRKGIPLSDEDRLPWLQTLANLISSHSESGMVLACSALKQRYRAMFISANPSLQIIFLRGDYQLLWTRMQQRQHFMPASLLQSQFDALEPPDQAIVLDVSLPLASLVDQTVRFLRDKT